MKGKTRSLTFARLLDNANVTAHAYVRALSLCDHVLKMGGILARDRGSTDLTALVLLKTIESQYSLVRHEQASLVSCLLHGAWTKLVYLNFPASRPKIHCFRPFP